MWKAALGLPVKNQPIFFLSLTWAGSDPGNLLWYSCLKNPIDRGAWWAMVQRVTKSWDTPE